MAAAWKKDWIIDLEARLRGAIESTLGLSHKISARGMRTGKTTV